MDDENLASQILMDEGDESLASLQNYAPNVTAQPFVLPDIGGQWPDENIAWNQNQQQRTDGRVRGGRHGGDEWKGGPGKKQGVPPVFGVQGQYWQEGAYRQQQQQQQPGQRANNMQPQYYCVNPWTMQQAAASAMIHMGKDPTNPQHWVQMAPPNAWQQAQRPKPQQYQGNNVYPVQQNRDWWGGNFIPNAEAVPEQAAGRTTKKGRRHRRKREANPEEETPLPPNCSLLLEEFRTKNKKLELIDIKLNIIEFATDQYGSRFIQEKLDTATDEEKELIEVAILENFQLLTTDVFGNYVVQKMFEYGNASQRRNLAEQLVGDVLTQALHMYGCRVIQKALESVSVEQQMLLISEIRSHVITCVEDQNGNHVIQKCIERMPPEKIQFIVDAFKGCVQRMACHCYGCRVLQRLIEHCTPPHQVAPILDEIVRCIPQLSQDQYGNYVVQHMLEHGRVNDRGLILEVVRSQILILSCHKFASNVVEKAIMCCSIDERVPILHAIIGDPSDVNPALLTMMRDRYGNYIVQRLLEMSQDSQKEMLLWRLKDQIHVLKKFTYGKHIVQALEERETRLASA